MMIAQKTKNEELNYSLFNIGSKLSIPIEIFNSGRRVYYISYIGMLISSTFVVTTVPFTYPLFILLTFIGFSSTTLLPLRCCNNQGGIFIKSK